MKCPRCSSEMVKGGKYYDRPTENSIQCLVQEWNCRGCLFTVTKAVKE